MRSIAYKDYKRSDDIHGTVLYPAVMVAPIQKNILLELNKSVKIKSVFDPFHGSGTSLYEALEISEDIALVGCDINPLANLITKVKLQGVSPSIFENIKELEMRIKRSRCKKTHKFPGSTKWFRDDIALELTKIRTAIIRTGNNQDRLFFWCMLSDVIRKYSNTRSSTYKLHTMPLEKIENMENNVISDFTDIINKGASLYCKSSKSFKLYKSDILEKIIDFNEKQFDVVITSPPYGDNKTTVPYGQFSMLSLYWIANKDLELSGWEFDSYSAIDSNSLGGAKSKVKFNEFEQSLIQPYLDNICASKHTKVLRFFSDYFIFLREICRVSRYYIVMTLGNRRVDGVKINLTNITMSYLNNNCFIKEKKMVREIQNKRTPRKTSSVNNAPVDSMSKEYVIIYKRDEKENSRVRS